MLGLRGFPPATRLPGQRSLANRNAGTHGNGGQVCGNGGQVGLFFFYIIPLFHHERKLHYVSIIP